MKFKVHIFFIKYRNFIENGRRFMIFEHIVKYVKYIKIFFNILINNRI